VEINFLKDFFIFNNINLSINVFISKLNRNNEPSSILSISDTLNKFQINHYVLKIDKNQIPELPNNFIALIRESRFSDESILRFFYKKDDFYISNNIKYSIEEFTDLFLNIVIIKNDDKVVKNDDNKFNYFLFLISFIPILIFNISPLFSIVISNFLGLLFSLISINLFSNNFIKKNICNSSCNELSTNNNWLIFRFINFSNISISYFITQLIFIIIHKMYSYSINESIFLFIALLTILFVIISLSYQVLQKKTCTICISISIILISQFYFFYSTSNLSSFEIITVIIYIIIHFLIYIIFNKFSSLKKDINLLQEKFLNKETFNSILKDRPEIIINNDIKLYLNYNKNNLNEIVIITNPLCYFCSKLIKFVLNEVKYNTDINICIVFNPLLFDSEENQNIMKNLIKSYNIDPASFLNNYSIAIQNSKNTYLNDKIINDKIINDKIKKMKDFCLENNLKSAPIVFVNNKLYPKQYSFKSLFKFI